MVFANPGAKIVELFGRHVYPYYYGLASVCNHEYHAILENAEEDYARIINYQAAVSVGSPQHQRETRAVSFEVDPELLRKTLQAIG